MGQVSVSVVCCAPRAGFCVSLPSRREKGAPEGSYSDFFLSRLLCGLTPAPACPSAGHVPSHPGLSFPEKTRQEAVSALPFPGGWEGIESSPRPVLTPPQAEPGSRVPVSPPSPRRCYCHSWGRFSPGLALSSAGNRHPRLCGIFCVGRPRPSGQHPGSPRCTGCAGGRHGSHSAAPGHPAAFRVWTQGGLLQDAESDGCSWWSLEDEGAALWTFIGDAPGDAPWGRP